MYVLSYYSIYVQRSKIEQISPQDLNFEDNIWNKLRLIDGELEMSKNQFRVLYSGLTQKCM